MTKHAAHPPHATWVSPYITVENIDTAIPFYQKAFGFEKLDAVPGEDGSTWHAELRYKNQLLMLGKAGAYKPGQSPKMSGVESPMNLYLYCEDVDSFYQNAIASGAESLEAPSDMFWGDRMCRLKDKDGYVWCFATYKST